MRKPKITCTIWVVSLKWLKVRRALHLIALALICLVGWKTAVGQDVRITEFGDLAIEWSGVTSGTYYGLEFSDRLVGNWHPCMVWNLRSTGSTMRLDFGIGAITNMAVASQVGWSDGHQFFRVVHSHERLGSPISTNWITLRNDCDRGITNIVIWVYGEEVDYYGSPVPGDYLALDALQEGHETGPVPFSLHDLLSYPAAWGYFDGYYYVGPSKVVLSGGFTLEPTLFFEYRIEGENHRILGFGSNEITVTRAPLN